MNFWPVVSKMSGTEELFVWAYFFHWSDAQEYVLTHKLVGQVWIGQEKLIIH